MITKITLFVIVGIGVIVFSIFSFQEKEDTRGPVLGEASIMEVMLAYNHKGYPVFEITLPIMTLNHKNKISNNIELEKITK